MHKSSSSSAPLLVLVLLVSVMVSGCELIGDVLEFGFWTGVIVVAVIALILWGIMKAFRR